MKREYDQDRVMALATRLCDVVAESGVTIAETLVAIGVLAAASLNRADPLSMTMGLSLIADVMKHSMEMDDRQERYDA